MLNKNSFLVIAVLILSSFILLFPHGRFNRSQNALQSFVLNSINQNSINVQQFWETREFYSPGHIILAKQVEEPNPFLTFTSDKWHSSEYLTKISTLAPSLSDECSNVLLMTQQDLICNLQDGSTFIAFIRDQNEMRKANVFFDPKHDVNSIEGKYWLVISYIR